MAPYLDELGEKVVDRKLPKQKGRFMIRKISRRSLFLLFLDALAILAAFFLTIYLRGDSWSYEYFLWSLKYFASPITFLSTIVFLTCFYIFDLYNPYKYFKTGQTFTDILCSGFLGGLILATISYLDRSFLIARPIFIISIGVLSFLVFCIRMLYDALFATRILDTRALIFGTGSLGCEIAQMIERTPHSGIKIVGFVHPDDGILLKDLTGLPILGDASSLRGLIYEHNIQLVILSVGSTEKLSESEFLYAMLKHNVQVISAVHLFEKLEGTIPYQVINDHYLLGFVDQVKRRNYLKVKRIIDILFSLFFLVVLSPVFLMTILLLSFQGVRRIFFVQIRIGENGIPFRLFKFRTMAEDSSGEKKITRIGQWLRKYRIDELPQVFNVLRGDMSLVGPRPEIPFFAEECQKWIPFYNVVFATRPGLTGWAQVKFKYTTSEQDYERKFCYNLFYLKNISPAVDLIILLKTIRIVLLGRGQ